MITEVATLTIHRVDCAIFPHSDTWCSALVEHLRRTSDGVGVCGDHLWPDNNLIVLDVVALKRILNKLKFLTEFAYVEL